MGSETRQCRAVRVGILTGTRRRCTLPLGHGGPVHFHDGIDSFVWWLTRGTRAHHGAVSGAGRTATADPWKMRLVIRSRELRKRIARARGTALGGEG